MDEVAKNYCRQILRRTAWRLQYATKKHYSKQHRLIEDILGEDITASIISQIYIQQLLLQLPEKASFIIRSTIIEGKTQQEVAKKLNMSIQGVSKCQRKYLRFLAQKMILSA